MTEPDSSPMPERSLRVKAPGGTLEFHFHSSFHRGDLTAVAPIFTTGQEGCIHAAFDPLKFLQAMNGNPQTDSSAGGKRLEAAAGDVLHARQQDLLASNAQNSRMKKCIMTFAGSLEG